MNHDDDINKMLDDAVSEFDEQEAAPSSPAEKNEALEGEYQEKAPSTPDSEALDKKEEADIEAFVESELGGTFIEENTAPAESTGIVPAGENAPVMNVIVEYRQDGEKESVAVIIDPQNMPGVAPHEFDIDQEKLLGAMVSSSGNPDNIVKDHLIKNHFDDIELMVKQLKESGFVKTGEDYAQSIEDMTALLAGQVASQLEKDRKKHQEMIDDLVRFGVDNIRHGSHLQAERFVEENVDFNVDIEGKGKDVEPEEAPENDDKKEDVGKLADMRANLSMQIGGRTINLGSMDYFYGIYEKKDGGVRAGDIKKTDAYSSLKQNVYSMVADGTLPMPRWLTLHILEKKLANEINHESAKHFGVAHKALQQQFPKNEDVREVFSMQLDQDITPEEAWALREADKKKEKEPEKSMEDSPSENFSP